MRGAFLLTSGPAEADPGVAAKLAKILVDGLPMLVVAAVVIAALVAANWLLLRRRSDLRAEARLPRQLAMLGLTALGIVLIVVALPVNDETQGQLLALLGVILTGIIALSSTTFVSNAMAGLMLRSQRSFRPGDFVKIDDHFGRVTERGLFHVEIQTEDKDLETLPNLYLASNPVRVVSSSGTVVSCTLSLGYDVPHQRIEGLLVDAARAADLEDPFVQVLGLGDFSVTYRVAGFLPEVKHLLSVRSGLRRRVLDTLHTAKIEIVSPTFIYQRRVDAEDQVIPPAVPRPMSPPAAPAAAPEEKIFDKAEQAAKLEALRTEQKTLEAELKKLGKEVHDTSDETRPAAEHALASGRARLDEIAAEIDALEEPGP